MNYSIYLYTPTPKLGCISVSLLNFNETLVKANEISNSCVQTNNQIELFALWLCKF